MQLLHPLKAMPALQARSSIEQMLVLVGLKQRALPRSSHSTAEVSNSSSMYRAS
jgi:hypothetical protein